MDLIPYDDFAALRLRDFVPDPSEVHGMGGTEFLGRTWVGEGIGHFTGLLCLQEEPERLRSISLDLAALPADVTRAVLHAIRLPLEIGMDHAALTSILGEPRETHVFTSDRTTYEYLCGDGDKYQISCTVHHRDGLIYLVVNTDDW
jgi:hypothetical protein